MAGTYSTHRVDLGAYLICKGYEIRRSFLKDGKVWFEFGVDGKGIEYDVADFYSGQGDNVSASAYSTASWKLSGLIKDIKRKQETVK